MMSEMPSDPLRPTQLLVQMDQLRRNVQILQKTAGNSRLMPILKANAYGHGLVPIAQMLEAERVTELGVAYLEEALVLRKSGIQIDILVLGGILGRQIPHFIEHNLLLTASSVEKLRAIDEAARGLGTKARVHLKFDTGMERIGTHWYSAQALLEASIECRWVHVEGIYSHLANADQGDLRDTRIQLDRFASLTSFYTDRALPCPTRHIANSAAFLRLPESRLDMVRPGLSLFGIAPSTYVPLPTGVAPALRWSSRVVYFKVIPAGTSVSYGSTWTSEKMTRIVTVPVGYGDGYMRRMSGQAQVLIHGKKYPVVGSICMDQIMVDIGWDEAFNGDEVVLLGTQSSESLGIEQFADWAGTVPYEILTAINSRVPRVYVEEARERP